MVSVRAAQREMGYRDCLAGNRLTIQIVWFKLTRRRVFLMAPLHHHFEFMAWSETKIMLRFWILFKWLHMPAYFALILWFALQL